MLGTDWKFCIKIYGDFLCIIYSNRIQKSPCIIMRGNKCHAAQQKIVMSTCVDPKVSCLLVIQDINNLMLVLLR